MFSQVNLDTFSELQTDAGVLLYDFSPDNPTLEDDNIICATTGGISVSCVPSFEDWGADIDNCPNNMLELKRITGYDCAISFTALNVTAEVIRLSVGAADITATNGPITPRRNLEAGDFADVWWVGDRSDGGLVAVKLINALSTSGFTLKTTKNGKGQISVTMSGHVSIKAQDVVPIEFYVQSSVG